MKIQFDVTDETTITNTTVKLTGMITGVVNGQSRDALEDKALALTKELFPDAKWAFSNFQYPDNFTFRVQVSTRIDASLNDQLDQKAERVSKKGDLQIAFSTPDASIPLHEKRKAESDLRVSLIAKAQEEAIKLGGEVKSVVFGIADSYGISNAKNATYASSAMRGVNLEAAGGAADRVALGHSEKIQLSASIVVKTTAGEKTVLNG
jgi:hypothetical protein